MTKIRKFSTQEAADYYGLKKNTLEIWRGKYKGPRYSKHGTRVLYDLDDLEEFFKARAVDTQDTAPPAWSRQVGPPPVMESRMDSATYSGAKARSLPRTLPCAQACTKSATQGAAHSGMEAATEDHRRRRRRRAFCPRGYSGLQIAILNALRSPHEVLAYWQIARLVREFHGLETTEGAVRGAIERLARYSLLARERAARGQRKGNRYVFKNDPCPYIHPLPESMESATQAGAESGEQSAGNAAPSILEEIDRKKNLSISSGESEAQTVARLLEALTEEDIAFHWPMLARQGFGTDQIRQIVSRLAQVNIGPENVRQGLMHAQWELAAEAITVKAASQGQTVTDFIRQRALDYRLRQTPLEKERVRQHVRIGTNLNQLARWVNIHKSRADMLTALHEAGLKINRAGKEYITVIVPSGEEHDGSLAEQGSPPRRRRRNSLASLSAGVSVPHQTTAESGEKFRLKGGIYAEHWKFELPGRENEGQKRTGPAGSGNSDPATVQRLAAELERIIEKRAQYNRNRYPAPVRQLGTERDFTLPDAERRLWLEMPANPGADLVHPDRRDVQRLVLAGPGREENHDSASGNFRTLGTERNPGSAERPNMGHVQGAWNHISRMARIIC